MFLISLREINIKNILKFVCVKYYSSNTFHIQRLMLNSSRVRARKISIKTLREKWKNYNDVFFSLREIKQENILKFVCVLSSSNTFTLYGRHDVHHNAVKKRIQGETILIDLIASFKMFTGAISPRASSTAWDDVWGCAFAFDAGCRPRPSRRRRPPPIVCCANAFTTQFQRNFRLYVPHSVECCLSLVLMHRTVFARCNKFQVV